MSRPMSHLPLRPSLWQRLGSSRAGVLLIGKVISPLQRRLIRLTGGRLSLAGSAPVLLLTTTGRRSGLPRTVPVFFLRDGSRYIVCNVNPGFERPNPWVLNLRAQPAGAVEVGGECFRVVAREADSDEADRYWPSLVDLWPAYERFHRRGGTRSIFILEPDDDGSTAGGTSGSPIGEGANE